MLRYRDDCTTLVLVFALAACRNIKTLLTCYFPIYVVGYTIYDQLQLETFQKYSSEELIKRSVAGSLMMLIPRLGVTFIIFYLSLDRELKQFLDKNKYRKKHEELQSVLDAQQDYILIVKK